MGWQYPPSSMSWGMHLQESLVCPSHWLRLALVARLPDQIGQILRVFPQVEPLFFVPVVIMLDSLEPVGGLACTGMSSAQAGAPYIRPKLTNTQPEISIQQTSVAKLQSGCPQSTGDEELRVTAPAEYMFEGQTFDVKCSAKTSKKTSKLSMAIYSGLYFIALKSEDYGGETSICKFVIVLVAGWAIILFPIAIYLLWMNTRVLKPSKLVDMGGQQERNKLIRELMSKAHVEFDHASKVLFLNHWNLSNSLQYIEKMRSSDGHRNFGRTNDASSRDSPHHQAIDMGLGAAVNLTNKSAPLQPQGNPFTTKPPRQLLSNQSSNQMLSNWRNPDERVMVPQPAELAVRLPPHQQHQTPQPKMQPQPVERRFPANPPQSHPHLYKPTTLPATAAASQDTQAASYISRVQIQTEPRSDLNNTVQPSRPSMVAPTSMAEEIDKEEQEEDDVFDDKVPTRKLPPLSGIPRLKRGFSNIIENEGLVFEARHNVQNDILKESHDNMYVQTFVLPDLTAYSEDFRAFLGKELIETSTLVSLEQAGRLNWWAELRLCQRLLPMATSGDGNCLLHAASLAMWGIHDRQLILRKELHEALTKAAYKDALYRRWRYQQTLTNKQSGLVFSEAEWQEEWSNILRLASTRPRGAPDPMRSNNCCDSAVTEGCEDPVVYESLEEFHVFVLAHVLQRPIIVVADTILKDSRGEALAPIPFPGIYLPLEVHPWYRSPLLLTYDAAHFSALAPMEQDPSISPQLPAAIPLVDPELRLLPLHFYIDPGPSVNWAKDVSHEKSLEDKINLLQKFLDVDHLTLKLMDSNGDSDRASMGSQDSDDMGGILTKDKKKEEKKKDAKVSQQMQNVAKQFGSIGKSMSKKLKQLGKVGKTDKSRRPSIGNEITQSTRIPNYGTNANNNEVVLVAMLSEKRGKQQQEMVSNYLADAKERFESDRELKRKNDIELRSKVARHPAVNSSGPCKTSGCNLFGTSQNNFYCTACYTARHTDVTRGGGQVIYNTFPGRNRGQQNLDLPKPADEIFIYGKSKFYTSSNEDIKQPQSENQLSVSEKDAKCRPASDILRSRTRSPTPDYDNVPRVHSMQPAQTQRPGSVSLPCKTAGCEFYGTSSYSGLCSKCYQQQRQSETSRVIHGNINTKL
ncbi:hypothetical protein EGW08_022383 [Elysia chlorotica]|uniref:ubiquitinyl hydrolase 1 n=1 Tax=Elysia chlorotica TaxID=188477 RepID=A0A433SL36_ELYCH|nr:hypothetical protein EGW08_022383 [Elysia chlorotica]